jgi:hypothetical protein
MDRVEMNRNDEQTNLLLNVVMALAAGALLGTLSVAPFQALGLSGSVGAILQSAISVALLGALDPCQVTDLTLDPGARSGVFLRGMKAAQTPRASQTSRVYTVEHKPFPKRLVSGSNSA